jgi:tetratricopeptide (TPR) repeat protein
LNAGKRAQRLDESRKAFQAGDLQGAQRICQALLRVNRGDVQALHILGVIASARADDKAAQACLSRCVAIEPRNATFHNDLARVHALAGRYGPAIALLERVLTLQPGHPQAITDLADVLERSGQAARAWALVQPLVERGTASEDTLVVAVRLLASAGQVDQAIALGHGQLAKPAFDTGTRRFLWQLMGRLLEKQTEQHRFNPAAHRRDIDALTSVFSPDNLARLPRPARRSDKPVFIACMPRSGSTLVEQIIHAHPQAFGGGEDTHLHRAIADLSASMGTAAGYPDCVLELDQPAVDGLAGRYLQHLDALSPGAQRVTNKHLLNYVHLGMVSVLFPGARVIHVRRDPLDNGLACYMTSLSTHVMPWAANLADIGFALREHDRLMAHWRASLDLRFLEVQYEELVNDTETQTRRIVDFCGLPWDDRCLRFWEAERVVLTPSYDQVRRPVFHTAVNRWRRYEQFLQPLKDALAPQASDPIRQ